MITCWECSKEIAPKLFCCLGSCVRRSQVPQSLRCLIPSFQIIWSIWFIINPLRYNLIFTIVFVEGDQILVLNNGREGLDLINMIGRSVLDIYTCKFRFLIQHIVVHLLLGHAYLLLFLHLLCYHLELLELLLVYANMSHRGLVRSLRCHHPLERLSQYLRSVIVIQSNNVRRLPLFALPL